MAGQQNTQYSPYNGHDSVTRSTMLNGKLGYAAAKRRPYVTVGVKVVLQEFTLGCGLSPVDETSSC